MAKYKVTIKVKAEVEYTVEVEADREHEAEDLAISMDQQMLPSDFQVNKGYITDWETEEIEQLTFVCQRCDKEYPMLDWLKHPDAIRPWSEDDDFCAPCGVEIEAEETAVWGEQQAR